MADGVDSFADGLYPFANGLYPFADGYNPFADGYNPFAGHIDELINLIHSDFNFFDAKYLCHYYTPQINPKDIVALPKKEEAGEAKAKKVKPGEVKAKKANADEAKSNKALSGRSRKPSSRRYRNRKTHQTKKNFERLLAHLLSRGAIRGDINSFTLDQDFKKIYIELLEEQLDELKLLRSSDIRSFDRRASTVGYRHSGLDYWLP